MNKRVWIFGVVALAMGASVAQAQSTNPPERMNGSNTTDNPATATTPMPGSPAALSSPGTASATTPALGGRSDPTAGTATPGANSFTEREARSRIQDSGFSQVSDLKLDRQGIWRAQANKDGRNVSVALDFKGNVVTQ